MLEFESPKPVVLKNQDPNAPPQTLSFRVYMEQVVFTLPYWRSSDEACSQAEEVLEQLEADAPRLLLRDTTVEKLREQMKLESGVGANLITQNPHLVRPSIRFLRAVNAAKKYVEPERATAQALPEEPLS